MRTLFLLIVILGLSGISSPSLARGKVSNEMKALGANKKLLRKARAVQAKNRIRIVQKRAVDRDLRFEANTGISFLAGGDPYVDSRLNTVNFDFHITPKFSLGARYAHFNNSLSAEGERIFNDAVENDVFRNVYDYPTSSTMGTLTWYPMYGKFNFFNQRVVQFDFYTFAGGGQIELASSGSQPIWTAGGGLGLWLSQHISTRFEVGYQTYNDSVSEDTSQEPNRKIEHTIFSINVGVLL